MGFIKIGGIDTPYTQQQYTHRSLKVPFEVPAVIIDLAQEIPGMFPRRYAKKMKGL